MSQSEVSYRQRGAGHWKCERSVPAFYLLSPPGWLLLARTLKCVSCLSSIQMHNKKDQSSSSDSVNYSLSLGKSLNLFEFNSNEPRELLNGSNEVKVVGMLCKLYKVIKHKLLLLTAFYCRLFLLLLQLLELFLAQD